MHLKHQIRWQPLKNLSIKYVHHNVSFSIVSMDDDNDIKGMFKSLVNDINKIYLFITKSVNEVDVHHEDQGLFL